MLSCVRHRSISIDITCSGGQSRNVRHLWQTQISWVLLAHVFSAPCDRVGTVPCHGSICLNVSDEPMMEEWILSGIVEGCYQLLISLPYVIECPAVAEDVSPIESALFPAPPAGFSRTSYISITNLACILHVWIEQRCESSMWADDVSCLQIPEAVFLFA